MVSRFRGGTPGPRFASFICLFVAWVAQAAANTTLTDLPALSLLYNPQILFIPLPSGQKDVYSEIGPNYPGIDPRDVNCGVDKPCVLNSSDTTSGKGVPSCPKGTIGLTTTYEYSGLDGKPQHKDVLVCNICADLGSYCDGRLVNLKDFSADGYASDNLVCHEGSWCINSFSTVPCPSGFYCARGSDLPVSCPPLAFCPAGSARPSHLAKWLLLLALCGFLLVSLFLRRAAAAASYYQDQSISIYAQRFAPQLRRWLAVTRHRIWLANSCAGPDPLHHRGMSVEVDWSPTDHHFDGQRYARPNHSRQSRRQRRTLLPTALVSQVPGDTQTAEQRGGYSVALKDVSVTFSSNQRQVLSRVSLRFEAGKIHGILGRTGVGKSVLLEMLAGFSDPKVATARGEAQFEGSQPISQHRLGFLSQMDIIPEYLTIDEALRSTLRLHQCIESVVHGKTAAATSAQDSDDLVIELERLLDLFSIRHNLVRSADQQAQGLGREARGTAAGGNGEDSSSSSCGCLDAVGDVFNTSGGTAGGGSDVSGGQRKRLALAMHMLQRPQVLLADEVSSSSDAATAQKLFKILRAMAKECGTTVILSIHQLRQRVFESFDTITLLGEGGVCFHGPPGRVAPYFHSLGFPGFEHRIPGAVTAAATEPDSKKTPQEGNPRSPASSSGSSSSSSSLSSGALAAASLPDLLLDVLSGLVPRRGYPSFHPSELQLEWESQTALGLIPWLADGSRAVPPPPPPLLQGSSAGVGSHNSDNDGRSAGDHTSNSSSASKDTVISLEGPASVQQIMPALAATAYTGASGDTAAPDAGDKSSIVVARAPSEGSSQQFVPLSSVASFSSLESFNRPSSAASQGPVEPTGDDPKLVAAAKAYQRFRRRSSMAEFERTLKIAERRRPNNALTPYTGIPAAPITVGIAAQPRRRVEKQGSADSATPSLTLPPKAQSGLARPSLWRAPVQTDAAPPLPGLVDSATVLLSSLEDSTGSTAPTLTPAMRTSALPGGTGVQLMATTTPALAPENSHGTSASVVSVGSLSATAGTTESEGSFNTVLIHVRSTTGESSTASSGNSNNRPADDQGAGMHARDGTAPNVFELNDAALAGRPERLRTRTRSMLTRTASASFNVLLAPIEEVHHEEDDYPPGQPMASNEPLHEHPVSYAVGAASMASSVIHHALSLGPPVTEATATAPPRLIHPTQLAAGDGEGKFSLSLTNERQRQQSGAFTVIRHAHSIDSGRLHALRNIAEQALESQAEEASAHPVHSTLPTEAALAVLNQRPEDEVSGGMRRRTTPSASASNAEGKNLSQDRPSADSGSDQQPKDSKRSPVFVVRKPAEAALVVSRAIAGGIILNYLMALVAWLAFAFVVGDYLEVTSSHDGLNVPLTLLDIAPYAIGAKATASDSALDAYAITKRTVLASELVPGALETDPRTAWTYVAVAILLVESVFALASGLYVRSRHLTPAEGRGTDAWLLPGVNVLVMGACVVILAVASHPQVTLAFACVLLLRTIPLVILTYRLRQRGTAQLRKLVGWRTMAGSRKPPGQSVTRPRAGVVSGTRRDTSRGILDVRTLIAEPARTLSAKAHLFALQFPIFLSRSLLQRSRQSSGDINFLLLLLCLGVVLGFLFGPGSNNVTSTPLKTLLTSLIVSLAAGASGIKSLQRHRGYFFREVAAGNSGLASFLALDVAGLPLTFLQPAAFLVGYTLFADPASSWFFQWALLVAVTYCSSGIGLWAAAVFPSDAATAMVSLIAASALFNGFNPSLRYLRELFGTDFIVVWSHLRWADEALFLSKLQGTTAAFKPAMMDLLSEFGFAQGDEWAPCFAAIVGLGFAWRAIGYWGLVTSQRHLQRKQQVRIAQRIACCKCRR